jgi:autotransporter-associated beta strand protein
MDTVDLPSNYDLSSLTASPTGDLNDGTGNLYLGITTPYPGWYNPVTLKAIAVTIQSIWHGSGADNKWSTYANWNGWAPAPGELLSFGSGTNMVTDNDYPNGTQFSGIIFTIDAAAYTLAGHTISLSGPITNDSSNNQTISLSLTGSSGLTKLGTGTVTLTGTSNLGGDSFVDGGTLAISNNGVVNAISNNLYLGYNASSSP